MQTAKLATSKIELRFSCQKLKDLDVLSKSDPMLVVFAENPYSKAWDLIGKTEWIKNNLNPVFKTPVKIDYFFEEVQKLKFQVFDIDNDHNLTNFNSQDLIGEAETTLSNILSKVGCTAQLELRDKHSKLAGTVVVRAEELKSSAFSLRLKLGGIKLDKKDIGPFASSDPYFTISRVSSNLSLVYTSEVIKNTLNPVWKEHIFSFEELGASVDPNAQVHIEVYDWDAIGKHDLIGIFNAPVSGLVTGAQFPLINPKKKEKKGDKYTNSGVIQVYDAEVTREYNFLEYIAGGCEISLVVGIDCTGSNGSPTSPSSLHYQHPTEPNQYAHSIVSIGSVLAPYDYDGMYPVFGFGGVIAGSSDVNHCFPMGMNVNNLYARGVEGILDTYYRNIKNVSFSGPTYFAPLIRETTRSFASAPQSQTQQKYTILLIITDGEILDMENTIDAIVEASSYPMSIVIVGVGNASFDNMNQLDGDDRVLRGSKGAVERDIVQFVPFNQYKNNIQALASETLKEIPLQFIQFMKKYKLKPNPPRVYQPPPTSTDLPPPPQ